MPKITMYTGAFCPYCTMAKRLLKQLGVQEIEEINISRQPEQFVRMQELAGQRTVPQIFIGDTHIGGFTDLYALHQRGGLMPLLQAE
nr:glutaredoxin 3 [uncultured Kingella sp.]